MGAQFDWDCWIGALEFVLGLLVDSVTADRWGGRPLANEQYRKLGQLANMDLEGRAVFYAYAPMLRGDSSELVKLLFQHPMIRQYQVVALTTWQYSWRGHQEVSEWTWRGWTSF